MNKRMILFFASLMFASAVYGYLAASYHLFPYKLLQEARQGAREVLMLLGLRRPWYYQPTDRTTKATIYQPEALAPGLTLVSGIGADYQIEARVVDRDGETIHHWRLNWFELWPDAKHISSAYQPKSPPGTHVHGILLMENGDLVFNLERTGLYRVDICGRVVWRVPRMTHHSLHRDEEGNFWVPGLDIATKHHTDRPGYMPPYKDFKILKISDAGEVIAEWSVIKLLKANDLESLLYMSTKNNDTMVVSGDTLHMNDVKTFPSTLPAGTFAPGDVMLSLRNINAVFVFDKNLESLKHMFIGPFARQHDPDFVDGNTITLFDNYTLSAKSNVPHSRILRLSVSDPVLKVLFAGTKEQPFFTKNMGKHQQLVNGNLLLTEARAGRAIEITPDNRFVWDYVNLVEKGVVGLMDEAQRLPPRFNKAFFANNSATCNR